MKKTAPFWWKIYLVVFATFVCISLGALLSPQSIVYAYFHTLIVFDIIYLIPYYINVASAILNVLSIIPISLFVFRNRFLHPHFWQWFVMLRLAFDIFGHSYEWKVLKSFYLTDLEIAFSALFIWAVLVFPSYVACIQYAFFHETILGRHNK